MALYIFIAAVVILFVFFGIWAARQQKKRLKLAEEFYAAPQIKALLDLGFIKGDDEIIGEINSYPAGIYCWFEVTGTRYFTYVMCKLPPAFRGPNINSKYSDERIGTKPMNILQQELKQIDGDTLAKSFARLQEVAAIEKFEHLPPRPPGVVITQ